MSQGHNQVFKTLGFSSLVGLFIVLAQCQELLGPFHAACLISTTQGVIPIFKMRKLRVREVTQNFQEFSLPCYAFG